MLLIRSSYSPVLSKTALNILIGKALLASTVCVLHCMGARVTKHGTADPLTSRIPVVALSANTMSHDIEKGLMADFLRYRTKPINISAFMEMLDTELSIFIN